MKGKKHSKASETFELERLSMSSNKNRSNKRVSPKNVYVLTTSFDRRNAEMVRNVQRRMWYLKNKCEKHPIECCEKKSAFVLNQITKISLAIEKKDAIIFSPKNQNNSSFEIYLWPFRFILFSIFTVNSSYENWPELYLFCSSFENCHKFGVCVSGAMKTFFFFWYT